MRSLWNIRWLWISISRKRSGTRDLGLEIISILEMLKSCGQMKSLGVIVQSENSGPRREL